MSDARKGAWIRANAAEVVDAVVNHGRSLNAAIVTGKAKLAPADRSLLRALSYGTLRFYWRLRAQVSSYLNRPLKSRDSVIDALLLIGLFQLTDTRISHHAAVSLTAEGARLLRRPKLVPLVNAVLRNFLRDDAPMPEPHDEQVQFNHPSWLIDCIRQDWPDDWQQILAANNDRAPMWLRVNSRHMTATQYLEDLAGACSAEHPDAATGTLVPGLDQAICLAHPWSVDDLPGFRDGHVSVQDGAAQVAAPWLLADGGNLVLDACAAPGGKTGHLLELTGSGAVLTAVESDAERAGQIEDNLQRLGLEATVRVADASKQNEWWDGELFDRILLDAPCSASGVIRRHPDIKHLRRASDLAAMAQLQRDLLDALWPLLAKGGRLLYVTCSVLRQENDAVIEHFKSRHEDVSEANVLPNNNIRDLMVATQQGFQILPGTRNVDGFYFACLERDS